MVSLRHEVTTAWHVLPIEAMFSRVRSTPSGLSGAEAARRLAEHGPNELQAAHRISPWTILFEQFKNVLIVILLVATVLSAFLGHGIEAIAIAVIVLLAVLLGFVQEYRAERAIEALRQMAAPTASALRDGREVEIPAHDLVPGDVVLLRAGNKIPADVRLIEAVNLQVEEAALTGESVPVEKHTAPLGSHELTIGDRKNMAHAGTAATYGRGRATVVATGMKTEFGKIAKMLQTVETGRTPLQVNLDKVGRTLARAAFVVVAIIVALGLFRGQPFIEMLIFGIALAVAVVPEALPAVVTISLAIGVQRLVRRNALMRRLPAVETLGSTSVICSDKTGTLTKDEMTARRLFVAGQMMEIPGAGYDIAMLNLGDSMADSLVAAHLDMHTRFPVTRRPGDAQSIVGYVNFKDIVAQLRLSPHEPSLPGILRPILSLDDGLAIASCLERMIREHTHIALVHDASEKVLGMITLEDIIEELVGEIHDEYDRLPAHILASGSACVVDGRITMPALKELTGIDLAADLPRPDVRNLSGWVAAHLAHPVRGGDVIERNGLRVLVRKVRRQQVFEAQISVRPRKEDT